MAGLSLNRTATASDLSGGNPRMKTVGSPGWIGTTGRVIGSVARDGQISKYLDTMIDSPLGERSGLILPI